MEWLVTPGVLAVLIVALIAVPAPPRVKFLAAPFIVPAWLAILGAIDQASSSAGDCYEECGYTWLYLFAIGTLIIASVVAALIGLVMAVVARRRGRLGRSTRATSA